MITIHSDDYGYSKKADRKICALIKLGKIQSVSVLTSMVSEKSLQNLASLYSSSEARSFLQSSWHLPRTIHISLHLNLVEKNMYKNLFSFVSSVVTKQLDVHKVEKEIRSQLSVLEKAGIRVDGIDSHQHAHALSPVAEIIQKIADEKKLAIRNYSDVKSITLIAKLKYYFLKTVAIVSHVIWNQKFTLPVSWKRQTSFWGASATPESDSGQARMTRKYSFMSWEGNSLDLDYLKFENLVAVIHPYLPFDSNRSYMKFLI